MLGRFCFEFTCGADVRHQRDVNIEGVAVAAVKAELTDCLQKRQGFNVTNGSADFDNGYVCTFGVFKNLALDLVGDVGMT